MAVNNILTHTTQKSNGKICKTNKKCCFLTVIPEQLELGRTKLGYLIQFGLVPYYKEQLFSSLLPVIGFAPKFVFCFDEAFSYILARKQMDVHVFYFH